MTDFRQDVNFELESISSGDGEEVEEFDRVLVVRTVPAFE